MAFKKSSLLKDTCNFRLNAGLASCRQKISGLTELFGTDGNYSWKSKLFQSTFRSKLFIRKVLLHIKQLNRIGNVFDVFLPKNLESSLQEKLSIFWFQSKSCCFHNNQILISKLSIDVRLASFRSLIKFLWCYSNACIGNSEKLFPDVTIQMIFDQDGVLQTLIISQLGHQWTQYVPMTYRKLVTVML